MPHRDRAVSPIISTILLVAVVVVLSATMSVFVLDLGSNIQSDAPYVEVSGEFVEAVDDGEQAIAITLLAGDTAQTEQLYVSGSKRLDIGGRPSGSSTPANDAYASRREKFTEASGDNPPQVGIGETWDAGETIYVDPEGAADSVTVSIYWTSMSVEGVNPGTPAGDTTYKLTTVEMGTSS
jgi:flagellin-like protein